MHFVSPIILHIYLLLYDALHSVQYVCRAVSAVKTLNKWAMKNSKHTVKKQNKTVTILVNQCKLLGQFM